MPIYVGGSKQGDLYVGGQKMKEVYVGNQKVYSASKFWEMGVNVEPTKSTPPRAPDWWGEYPFNQSDANLVNVGGTLYCNILTFVPGVTAVNQAIAYLGDMSAFQGTTLEFDGTVTQGGTGVGFVIVRGYSQGFLAGDFIDYVSEQLGPNQSLQTPITWGPVNGGWPYIHVIVNPVSENLQSVEVETSFTNLSINPS